MTGGTVHPASFRDPAGFIFETNGKVYRQVNKVYAGHYDYLINSGLYDLLIKKNYLLPHTETKEIIFAQDSYYATLLPGQLPFISYPYEWCFEQLKDAALLTLEIVKQSVEKGMILKDATPFNIQFLKGKPVFIDTLSFEKYDETQPWIAYRQFCECFLFPLLLAHYHKMNFQQLLNTYADGIPADVTAKLLPAKSRLSLGVWLHVRLQNRVSKKSAPDTSTHNFNKRKLLNLVSHLESIIQNLNNSSKTSWSGYYTESISSPEYLKEKERVVRDLLVKATGNRVLDLGANDGYFSFIAAESGHTVVATDNDEQCIGNLYNKIKKTNISNILPLRIDITNPSPDSGFANRERSAFSKRIQADLIMVLALIHHLAIGKNISFQMIAGYLSELAPQLLIEFVPKEDEKTKLLLLNKKDIYPEYNQERFEQIFQQYFVIEKKERVAETGRCIYLMKRIPNQ